MIDKNYMKISIFLTVVFSIFIITHGTSLASSEYSDFKLQDSNGNTVSTTDYENSILVLEWINPDCPFVQRHANEKTMKTL